MSLYSSAALNVFGTLLDPVTSPLYGVYGCIKFQCRRKEFPAEIPLSFLCATSCIVSHHQHFTSNAFYLSVEWEDFDLSLEMRKLESRRFGNFSKMT